jgi:hypothetical protein
MRTWLFPLLPLLLFSACSRHSAFEYFTRLDSREERAVMNLQRVTLNENNRTTALISTIYLNPVDPGLYKSGEFFLVALYDRRGKSLESYTVTLNGQAPAGLVSLDENCSLRALMPLNNPWNGYYELVFKSQKDAKLTLRFETDPSLRGEVTYDTDQ